MRAYRVSVNLKLGLIAFALLIAFASLAYTQRLVRQLGEREQFIIQLWAAAQERVADASLHVNPYISELDRLDSLVAGSGSPGPRVSRLREALSWARDMPPAGGISLAQARDRKSTRLNSSHVATSFAVLCWEEKKRVSSRRGA